jgi:hypothetical protein
MKALKTKITSEFQTKQSSTQPQILQYIGPEAPKPHRTPKDNNTPKPKRNNNISAIFPKLSKHMRFFDSCEAAPCLKNWKPRVEAAIYPR